MVTDELKTIGKISALLDALPDQQARSRVLRYINDVEYRRELPQPAAYPKGPFDLVEPMQCREPELDGD